MSINRLPLWSLVLVLPLAGCGRDPVSIKLPVSVPSVTTLRLSTDTVTLWAVGRTSQFAVEARDGQSRVMATPALTWTSSAPAVATIDEGGRVTAVGDGDAVVTARYGEVAAAARVRVRAVVQFSARLSASRNSVPDTAKAAARATMIVRARP